MEKFLESLEEAEKTMKTLDHMVYVTFPLIKDKRLLLKVIQEIKKSVTDCITAILQFEYLFKRVNLSRDPKENFKTFTEKCAPKYGIDKNELALIFELFDFVEKHKASPFEFIKGEKVVILSESMNQTTLSLDKTKQFLNMAKDILKKTREGMRKNVG
ncbi:MAG: hypothetical protein ABSG05_03030 [Candidatus Pacearchaeota archaeon]|jgi:hypothetical protein